MGQNLGWGHLGQDEKKPPKNHQKVDFGGFFKPAFAIIANLLEPREACKLLILFNWRKRMIPNPLEALGLDSIAADVIRRLRDAIDRTFGRGFSDPVFQG